MFDGVDRKPGGTRMAGHIDEHASGDEKRRFADGPVVVFTWRNEPGWPVEYVSPSVERILGYPPEELVDGNPPYAELVHDDDIDRVLREVKEHSDATTERFHHEPYRMVTREGDVRWVLDYTRILRGDDAVVGYTGYVVDITERKERLEYVTALNATIRSLHEVLIDADSREQIHEDVCRSLSRLDRFGGVWTGTADPSTEAVEPTAWAGITESRLGSIRRSSALSVRVATDRSVDQDHRTVDDPDGDPWPAALSDAGYASVLSVPIRHEGIRYGVLTVYGTDTDTFDPRVRDILAELGVLVGYAVSAAERRNALHADGSRELVLGVGIDDDDPLRVLAERLSTALEVRSVSRRKDGTPVLYCLLPDADPERALPTAESVPGIRSIERLSGTDTPLYGIVADPDCVAATATALGANLRSLRVTDADCAFAVSVRRDRDQRRFLRQARELFGRAELRAERDADAPDTTPWLGLLADVLTDRQRNVLRAAYHEGYFDENRKRTGAEIADSLGIAQPTFSTHMRAAQRNLFAAIWGDYDAD